MLKISRISALILLFLIVSVSQADDNVLGRDYSNLLKKQGYTPLKAPRADFGVGTVVPVDPKKNLYIAGQEECFPGLESSLHEDTTKLINSKDVKNLQIDASGNYSPTGTTSFLSKLAAAFGFTSNATMDVSFGDTTAVNLTAIGLQNYLTGHKISKACAERLKDPKNAIIFSMARVSSMTYTFAGEHKLNGSVNANVGAAITATGSLTYDHTTNNSVTITTPLYVGYNAFTLNDVAIEEAGDASGASRIRKVTVAKAPSAVFPATVAPQKHQPRK